MNKDFFLHLKAAYQTLKIFPAFFGLGRNNINPVLKISNEYLEFRVVFKLKKILISDIAETKTGTFKNYVVIIPKQGMLKYVFAMDNEKNAQEVIQALKN